MVNSKSKGNTFERTICRTLSLWWTQNDEIPNDSVFWRSVTSGGFATTRAKKGLTATGTYGDITALDIVGKPLLDVCCFELKCGYKPSALDLVERKNWKTNPVLIDFLNQAGTSASQAQVPHPIVIFKRTGKQPCVIFMGDLKSDLEPYIGNLESQDEGSMILKCITGEEDFYITTLEMFLEWCTPEAIKQLASKKGGS